MSVFLGQITFGAFTVEGRGPSAAVSRVTHRLGGQIVLDAAEACLVMAGGAAGRGRGGCVGMLQGFLSEADELAHVLGVAPGSSPGHLVALAAERWWHEAPKHLAGEYAAAVYQKEERRALLLRDHIGTRPIYWHWRDSTLSFATHLPDLLSILPRPPAPDEESIASFLRDPIALGPRTLLKGVKVVEPGHILTIDAGGPRARRWWRMEEAPDVRFSRRDEYADAARELVARAVATRLPRTGKIGAHLSGGLDSTAVTLIAQEQLRARGETLSQVYSWSPPISADVPELDGLDDRRKVLSICSDAGLSPRFATIDGAAFRRFLARPIEEEGLADVADEFSTLEQAQADGVGVMLSGWGGDEAFSAHAPGVPAWLLKNGRLMDVGRIARANAGLRRPDRMTQFLWKTALVPMLPDGLFRRFGPYDNIYSEGCYASPSLKVWNTADRPQPSARFTADPISDIRNALRRGHIGERMATWSAWGRPFGVEYRYPLTDKRLLEFTLGMPPDMLWGDSRSRFLARQTLKGRVKGWVGKSDPANERKRLQELRTCWTLLSREASEGLFDNDCAWLDMSALRKDLLQGASGNDRADVLMFARIMPAIRIWHMAKRYGAIAASRVGQD